MSKSRFFYRAVSMTALAGITADSIRHAIKKDADHRREFQKQHPDIKMKYQYEYISLGGCRGYLKATISADESTQPIARKTQNP